METMTAQQRLDHMKTAIVEGGVALYKGRTIGTVAGLPTLSELATTTEERTAALSDIELRKKALADEEARVRSQMSGQPLGSGDNVTTTGPGAAGGEGTGESAGSKKSSGSKAAGGASGGGGPEQPLQTK